MGHQGGVMVLTVSTDGVCIGDMLGTKLDSRRQAAVSYPYKGSSWKKGGRTLVTTLGVPSEEDMSL